MSKSDGNIGTATKCLYEHTLLLFLLFFFFEYSYNFNIGFLDLIKELSAKIVNFIVYWWFLFSDRLTCVQCIGLD